MTASMLGIPIMDTTISTVENNPDSLQPYKLTFYADNNFVESDQQDLPVGGGWWSQNGNILTITDQDTTLELIINDISKSNNKLVNSVSEPIIIRSIASRIANMEWRAESKKSGQIPYQAEKAKPFSLSAMLTNNLINKK